MNSDRLQLPDGAVVTVVGSPSDPARAPLVMEFVVPPGAMPTASHVHPHQKETYAVQEGSMEVLVDSTWFTLEAGQSATVPANTPHAFRNRSGETVRFLNEHRPALRFEEYFRAVHGLSEAGKIRGGFDVRGVLYACVLMEEYGDTMQQVGGMQRTLIGGLAAVGRVLGYEANYPNYSGPDPPHSDKEGRRVTYEAKMVAAAALTIFAIFALFFLRRWIDRASRS
jgi:mannose-6-phosphate isomerase-like protein (cupin superfamily)